MAATPLQPRTRGAARIVVHGDRTGRTRLSHLHQSGALKLVFPQVFRSDMEAIIVNTAGGITGGDDIALQAEVSGPACLTLSTQAAERIYRAQPGEVGCVRTHLRVAGGARLNWLPQETIFFDHAALDRELRVDLGPDAKFLMVESLIFGRAAMGEVLSWVTLRDRVRIRRGGMPLVLDGIDLAEQGAAHLGRAAVADGAGAVASVVLVSPGAALHVDMARRLLPGTGGATALASDVLLVRLVADDGFELRRSLIPVLMHLNDGRLPLNWRL